MKIKLSGKDSKNKNTSIIIPVNPEELKYKAAGRFQEYEIINLGTARKPSGKDIEYVSWESFFPGKLLKSDPYVRNYKSPNTYHKMLKYWRESGKKIKLTITETPISMHVYIENYEGTWKGANGSVYYSIELSGSIDVTVETVKKKKGKTSGASRTSKKSSAKKHTVKKGDTLWAIGKKYYKKASMANCNKIYNANKTTIENAAKKHKKKSSNKGQWIYPGTVLKIP